MSIFTRHAKVAILTVLATAMVSSGAAVAQDSGSAPDLARAENPSVAPPEERTDEDPEGNPYAAGELIVTYEEAVSATAEETVNREAGAATEGDLPALDAKVISVPEVKAEGDEATREEALEAVRRDLEADPRVETVDYNHRRKALAVPNDAGYSYQWGLPRIGAPEAWDATTGAGARIAVIDTGVDNAHPDLAGAIADEHDYVEGDADAQDGQGHGTHVAGIAAARTNNSLGVAGTAPSAALFDYRVLDSTGSGTVADEIAAIQDAVVKGADVINLSLGGSSGGAAEENAINFAWNSGVVVIAAAGNDFEYGNSTNYPAAYANAVAVGAVDYSNSRSNFSNTGSYLDIAAPGGSSVTGTPREQRIYSTIPTSSYAFYNGTSMATPFVSGVAALLASQGLDAAQVRQRLESTATDLGTAGRDDSFGAGLVNARAAVGASSAPQPASTASDTTKPSGSIAINGGSAKTRSRTVTLTLNATDPGSPSSGVSAVRVSNNGRTWSSWSAFSPGKYRWRLGKATGTKRVYAQYRDAAGNVSATYRDAIRYTG